MNLPSRIIRIALALTIPPMGVLAQGTTTQGDKGQFALKTVKSLQPATDAGSHTGIFVGINQFTRDSTVRPLNFAVNDAITLAHVFVLEIKLISPKHAVLMLQGDAVGEDCVRELAELRAAGVQVESSAGRTEMLDRLRGSARQVSGAGQLLIAAISSHGFESDGHAYVMPSDGKMEMLKDTALDVLAIENALNANTDCKRVLFLDACRIDLLEGPKLMPGIHKVPTRGAKMTAGMHSNFKAALEKIAGQAIYASADVGQISWEDASLRHGAFLASVIRGLRGHAQADSTGMIRLDQLVSYVEPNLAAWCIANGKPVQRPWFKGPVTAGRIPLAVDTGLRERSQARMNKLRAMFVDAGSADRLTAEEFQEAQRLLTDGAMTAMETERQGIYENLADGKTDISTARIALRKLVVPPPPKPEKPPVEPKAEPEKGRPGAARKKPMAAPMEGVTITILTPREGESLSIKMRNYTVKWRIDGYSDPRFELRLLNDNKSPFKSIGRGGKDVGNGQYTYGWTPRGVSPGPYHVQIHDTKSGANATVKVEFK